MKTRTFQILIRLAFLSLLFVLSFSLYNCGGGVEGHTQFSSVTVGIRDIVPSHLQSDVFVKVDNNNDGICDSIHVQDDTVVVSLYSYVYSKEINKNPSPIYIDRYRLTFFNASSANNCERNYSCALLFKESVERFISLSINPDEKVYTTIVVIPSDWKYILMNYCTSPADSCKYNVFIELHATEVFSGKSVWIDGEFTVNIGDYVQGNANTYKDGKISVISEKDNNCKLPGE